MIKFGAACAAALALCAAAAAEAAQFVEVGPRSGVFGFANVTKGGFTHTFTFTWPAAGTSGSDITSGRVDALTNIDFRSVTLNGVEFTIGSSGVNEFRFANGVPAPTGLQTLTVRGVSGGNGSYAGTLAFSPSNGNGAGPVPEPAVWGLMTAGFGLVGGALRRRFAVHA